MNAAIKCGNCKGYHESVQAVKDCHTLGAAPTTHAPATPQAQATAATWAKRNDQWLIRVPEGAAHTGDKVTVHKRDGSTQEVVLGVQVAAAIKENAWLFRQAQAKGQVVLPDVPEGHYAVASATGNNDLDFYRVDRPTEGKWAGRTFVKRIIGGHPDVPVRGVEAKAALERILADGVQEAALRYGREIGRCCRCNRHLTDETSRAFGMGPDCREVVGW